MRVTLDILFLIVSLALVWRGTRNLALSYVECRYAYRVREPHEWDRWVSSPDLLRLRIGTRFIWVTWVALFMVNRMAWAACFAVGLTFLGVKMGIPDGVSQDLLIAVLAAYILGVVVHKYAYEYRRMGTTLPYDEYTTQVDVAMRSAVSFRDWLDEWNEKERKLELFLLFIIVGLLLRNDIARLVSYLLPQTPPSGYWIHAIYFACAWIVAESIFRRILAQNSRTMTGKVAVSDMKVPQW